MIAHAVIFITVHNYVQCYRLCLLYYARDLCGLYTMGYKFVPLSTVTLTPAPRGNHHLALCFFSGLIFLGSAHE